MPVSPLTLQSCALFAEADDALLRLAAQQMQLLELRKREVLRFEHTAFAGLGVVVNGVMQAMDMTADGREVALLTVPAGQAFGYVGVLAESPTEMTWVAAQNATTLALMPLAQAQWLLAQPTVTLGLSRLLAQRVSDLMDLQKIQGIHPVGVRICAWLKRRSLRAAVLQLPTHAELALQLNTTRESVTRVLQRLQADGVLRRSGDVWQVLQPALLAELARGDRLL